MFQEFALSRIALALALVALPGAAFSQPAITCATFAEASGIPAPPDSLTDQAALMAVTEVFLPVSFDIDQFADLMGAETMPLPDIPESRGCSLRELAMLTANFAAIGPAQPPADPAELAGTWMSDDIFLSVAGVTVPGHEVLVIGDPVPVPDGPRKSMLDPEPGSLPVSQYWYHGFTPYQYPVWNAQNEYYGLIVSGYLTSDGQGGYADNPAMPTLNYAGTTIIPERTEDLFLKSRLNVFQRDVILALAQDTLVVTYDAPIPIQRVWTERQRTYHRVADGSPDAALRMVRGMELRMMPYFGCLTRMISTEDPALAAAMAPMTPAEFDAAQREYDRWSLDRDAYEAVVLRGDEDEALKTKVVSRAEQMLKLSIDHSKLGRTIEAARLCPEPPRIGL